MNKEYNAADDFARSIEVAREAIRQRVAAGGPGWVPHAIFPLTEDRSDEERQLER